MVIISIISFPILKLMMTQLLLLSLGRRQHTIAKLEFLSYILKIPCLRLL